MTKPPVKVKQPLFIKINLKICRNYSITCSVSPNIILGGYEISPHKKSLQFIFLSDL